MSPVERNLAGDFFCAPFGADDGLNGPAHGWTANSAWDPHPSDEGSLKLALKQKVMGATVFKHLRLSETAPLLYQEHIVESGEGALTASHHPMIGMKAGGTLSVSKKQIALTEPNPLETGRNRLAVGAIVEDLGSFPSSDGGLVDLTDLPIGDRHEDFVVLVEAANSDLGWSAVVRREEEDIVFVLKNPAILPVTMLWHSNGGRDYQPWDSRHRGVLGIEDARAAGTSGLNAAAKPNPVSAYGVPTYFNLGTRIRIPHVIGAIPHPSGWVRITSIETGEGSLILTSQSGETIALPF